MIAAHAIQNTKNFSSGLSDSDGPQHFLTLYLDWVDNTIVLDYDIKEKSGTVFKNGLWLYFLSIELNSK